MYETCMSNVSYGLGWPSWHTPCSFFAVAWECVPPHCCHIDLDSWGQGVTFFSQRTVGITTQDCGKVGLVCCLVIWWVPLTLLE
jgi:hypothetical protein